ncbi:MAG: transcription termination factor NusA [Candidatus Kerfeldbacteria bacterium]
MAKSELNLAIEQLCDEKNIPYESVIESIEAALAVAYRKESGNKMLNVRVEFNTDDGTSRFFDVKTVTEDPPEEELEELEKKAEAEKNEEEKGRRRDDKKEGKDEEEEKRFNPRTDVGITDALQIKEDAEIGDEIISELPTPEDFGRVAAQTAKQVIIQKLREAERETLFNQYKDRVGEIVNATVHRVEGRMVYMDLGQATALMPPPEQSPNERYNIGDRYKVFLRSVEQGRRGPEIIASRTASEMVEELFKMEVPEISSGSIEVKAVAREAGSRSKIAVISLVDNIDPIGSCVGQRGARVQTVMSELGGEKIDIIEWDDDAVKFIVNSLSPAKVISVKLDEKEKIAKAYVVEDQLSLAIGKGGQNVRLAAKLSGWKIDIVKDESGASEESGEAEDKEEAPKEAKKKDDKKEEKPKAKKEDDKKDKDKKEDK